MLADTFYKGDLASNKHQVKHWFKSWNNLQKKAHQFQQNPAYMACESLLKIDNQRIDFINQTIKKMGVNPHKNTAAPKKYDNTFHKGDSLNNDDFKGNKTQNHHYDLNLINDIAKSNPKEIYTCILGKPSKSSASELRYRGGLIVTLKGTKKGLWYDFSEGHGGGIIQAIQRERGVDIKEAIAIAANITGVDKSTNICNKSITRTINTTQSIDDLNEVKYKKASTKSAISIWNGCVDIKGTLAEKYLVKHRKIIDTDSLNIKYWPAGSKWMNVSKDGKVEYKINKTPALVVAAIDNNGEIKAVQRTYLDPKTASKNHFFDNPKLTKGPTKSHFCKLQNGSRGSDLYLAEGVETGASIAQLKPNDHILVSFGQDNMKNLTDVISKISPRNVYIAADNDGLKSPSKSLEETINSLQSKGIKVDILMPYMLQNTTKTDWNDVLKNKGKRDFYLEIESKLNSKYSGVDLLKDDILLAKTVDKESCHLPNADHSISTNKHHSQVFVRELIDREMEI